MLPDNENQGEPRAQPNNSWSSSSANYSSTPSSHFSPKALLTGGSVLLVAALVGGVLLLGHSSSKAKPPTPQTQAPTSSENYVAPVSGQLQTTNSITLTPGVAPTSPQQGEVYFDRLANAPAYYDGSQFVSLAPQTHVSSLGGASGQIGLGPGLQIVGGQLLLAGTSSSTSPSISLSGSTGQIALISGSNALGGSLLSQVGSGLVLSGSLKIGGVTLHAGSGANLTLTLPAVDGSSGQCLATNGSGVLGFQSCSVTFNNAKADGLTKGIATFNSTNFSDNGSGLINTIQNIATNASPTFNALTLASLGSGVIHSNAGSLTSAGVALGTDTTGNYIDHIGALGVGINEGGSNNVPGAVPSLSLASTGNGAPFVQGGNSFGATAVLGTNDSNSLNIDTNGATQASVAVGGATTFKNSANSTAAFQIQNAGGTSTLFVADTTNAKVGIGGAPSSGGVLFQVSGAIFGTGLYTGSSVASEVLRIDSSGNLNNIGHLVTTGSASAAVQSGAGSGGSPSCSVSGDDTSGQITLTTGTSAWGSGAQCIISFASSYGSAPHPVITQASSQSTSAVNPYATSLVGSFTINFGSADTAQHTYTWNYFNAQ